MTREAVLDAIEGTYRSVTGKRVRDLRPGDELVDDLGLDSLQGMEMLMDLERTYGVEIVNTAAMATISTVGDLIDVIVERTAVAVEG